MNDYVKPISQDEIEREIMRLVAVLEDATDSFGVLAEDEAKKQAAYKSEWAQTFLSSDRKTVKEREAWADYKSEMLSYEAKIADALVRAQREKLSSLRESIGALRTLAANVRAQT